MKRSLLLVVLGSAVALGGCESSQVARQSDTRQMEVAGGQGGVATVTIPENQPHYSLRGKGEVPSADSVSGGNHM